MNESLTLQDDDAAVVFRADGTITTLISRSTNSTAALSAMVVAQLFSNVALDDILQVLMRRVCGGREETMQ